MSSCLKTQSPPNFEHIPEAEGNDYRLSFSQEKLAFIGLITLLD
jgi:hypothetical protein